MEFSKEYIDFVAQHAADDPTRLRLRFHGDTRQWVPYAIDNIAALKKRKKFKLHDGRDFTPTVIPFELSAQQATSASIAQFHAELAGDAHTILDMTFGIGMDARFLAMGSNRRILGFDLREELVGAAKVNFADFPNVEVRQGDSVEFLKHYNGEKFDLIFIDPARRGSEGERLYNLHDCQPDLIELLPLIKAKSKRLIAKLSPMLDVTQTLRDLPGIVQLHVVEEGNECKELLAVIDFASGNEAIGTTSAISTAMICIDRLVSGERRQFAFTQAQEATTPLALLNRMPVAGEFICEPSAATMKAAPFNLLSTKFEAPALHPNSHLYVAPTAPSAFPGNCYEICQAVALTSSNLKQIAKSVDRADIAVRNLKGFTSDVLRKRLKLKSGGNLRLFATTLATSAGDTPILVLCKLSAPLS
jgi:hypothetical protein